jgi:hypothetical protein
MARKPNIGAMLDGLFAGSLGTTIVLTGDRESGKVQCAVFHDAFGEHPMRFSNSGEASTVLENILTSIPSAMAADLDAEPAKPAPKAKARRRDDDVI